MKELQMPPERSRADDSGAEASSQPPAERLDMVDIAAPDPTQVDQLKMAKRIEHLFETVPNGAKGHWTNVDLAAFLTARGIPTTGAYISMLRHGRRTNPSLAVISGMAVAFSVPTAYFYDDELAQRLDEDMELLVAVKQSGLANIALRSKGLSPRSLRELEQIIDAVRRIDGLDEQAVEVDGDRT